MYLSRRNFVQGVIWGGAALGVVGAAQSHRSLTPPPQSGDISGFAPPAALLDSECFALAKLFPSLSDPDTLEGPLIANTRSREHPFAGYVHHGNPGNAIFFKHAGARPQIPWTPIFSRKSSLFELPTSIKRQIDCADLLVVNESSPHYPVFGNKARKYEFLLPNLKWSGAQRLGTMGAVSSNHALQFAIANRTVDLTGDGQALNCELELVLFEVPGVAEDTARLALLRGFVQRLVVTKNDVELVGEAALEYARQWLHPDTDTVVPPGGSNELSVLGHMNAVAELAQLLDAAQAWQTPPDVIFVPMGTGSTVLGLLFGVHILGWKTKVVGVADQDKSYLTRWLLNREPSLPLVEGNVVQLARSTAKWLHEIRFPRISSDVVGRIWDENFVPDSHSWAPGYGLIESTDVAWAEELKAEGLQLDPVFTAKAWRSLLSMSKAGALKNKKVIFWNTYNNFDYSLPRISSVG
jgi:1-aminocyclopropane-1-carboxylate deaminase/D-cysteine desulfhydrase-like pyridoxal-dependent ACC family enzyme